MSNQFQLRPSSQIQRTVRNGAAVFEKQYVTNEWDDDADLIRNRARTEVDLLRQLSASDKFSGRLGVVRIADADPDAATIATYEIEGISLEQFIHSGVDAAKNLTPWLLAGRWLRRFQSLPLTDDAAETVSRRDPADIVDYCDLRLRSLAEFNYPCPSESTRKNLLRSIEYFRGRCQPSDIRPVWVHADYAPGNLMWEGRVLTPIDFAMARPGNPLEDATYLIHRVEMQRVYRPWLRLPVERIRHAILRGLGTPAANQSPAYQMLMLKHLICRLHTYARRPARNFKQSLHDRWVRRVLRHQLVSAAARAKK